MKKQEFTLLIFVLLLSLIAPVQITRAQSDEVLNRVDQAMAHLTNFLSSDFDITRSTNFWEWREEVWNNIAMDCGVPGVEYPNELTRGYVINVTVNDIVYEYHAKADGSVLILCIDGLPDPSSVNFDTSGLGQQPAPTGPVFEQVPLSPGSNWAWFYDRPADTLYLMNPTGVQAQLPRPKLTNELIGEEQQIQVAVSRPGDYLLVAARLNNGNQGLGIYNFATGQMVQEHEADPNEDILLSFGNIHGLDSSPDGGNMAVSFLTGDFANPSWRIIDFELATGNVAAELSSDDSIITESGIALPEDGVFAPRVVLYDAESNIHFQYVIWFTEGLNEYDAHAWNPQTDQFTTSPYTIASAGISTNDGTMVYTFRDNDLPILPENGPFQSQNTVVVGFPGSAEQVWADGDRYHFAAQWAADDSLILFRTSGETPDSDLWHVLDSESDVKYDLLPEITGVAGVPGGLWSIADSGTIAFHNAGNPTAGSPVWTGTNPMTIVWAEPSEGAFALTTVTVPGQVEGPIYCPGAPPSTISVGIRARVTSSDEDPLPLRLRQTPGGEFIVSIDEGTEFSVIGGPQCADQYTWWNIRMADGTTGWSAEGDANNYFMEPVP